MFIQLTEDPTHVHSFAQLFTHTLQMIPQGAYGKVTTVLGPVTAETPREQQKNIETIARHESILARRGWWVVCLSTYEDTYERLLREHRVTGYPQIIMDEFMFPLIESGYLNTAHVRENYVESRGATQEHAKLIECGVPIRYLP